MTTVAEYQKQARADDLTIVMVSFKSISLVKKNIETTTRLNPTQKIWWIVIDNSLESDDRFVGECADDVVLIPGTSLLESERSNIYSGSIHHAKSLNIGLAYTKTDWVLVLDPDCFVIVPNWIDLVRQAMVANGHIFWGTPYHPERFGRFNVFGGKFMYFPTAICMMIDRGRLQSRYHSHALDFTPPYSGKCNEVAYREEVQDLLRGRLVKKDWRLARGWYQLIRMHGIKGICDALFMVCRRLLEPKQRDTGFMIYDLYHKKVPHGVTKVNYKRKFPSLFWLWKWIIPQSWCGYPKRSGHWTSIGSELLSGVKVGRGSWEVFVWNEQPFAIHVGSSGIGNSAAHNDLSLLDAVLEKQDLSLSKAA